MTPRRMVLVALAAALLGAPLAAAAPPDVDPNRPCHTINSIRPMLPCAD